MRLHRGSGSTLTVVAAAAVTAGVPFQLGTMVLVPVHDAAIGEEVACLHGEEVTLPKVDAVAMAAGALVEWDATNDQVVADAAGDFDLGIVTRAAGASDTTVSLVCIRS